MSESHNNGATTEEAPVGQTEQPATEAHGCAGGCCTPPTPNQQMRNEAMMILRRAHEFLEKDEINGGIALLAAAVFLISESDGSHDCEESVWLMTTEILLHEKLGDSVAMVFSAEQANREAERLFGAAHPMTAVTQGNLGEVLLKTGERKDGESVMKLAIERLRSLPAEGKYTRQYMDATADSMQKTLDELLAKPAASPSPPEPTMSEPQAAPASALDCCGGDHQGAAAQQSHECCGGQGGDNCCNGTNEGCACDSKS